MNGGICQVYLLVLSHIIYCIVHSFMDDWVLVQVKSRYKWNPLVLLYNHSNYYHTIMLLQYHWTLLFCLSSSILASTHNFYFSQFLFDYLLLVTLYYSKQNFYILWYRDDDTIMFFSMYFSCINFEGENGAPAKIIIMVGTIPVSSLYRKCRMDSDYAWFDIQKNIIW